MQWHWHTCTIVIVEEQKYQAMQLQYTTSRSQEPIANAEIKPILNNYLGFPFKCGSLLPALISLCSTEPFFSSPYRKLQGNWWRISETRQIQNIIRGVESGRHLPNFVTVLDGTGRGDQGKWDAKRYKNGCGCLKKNPEPHVWYLTQLKPSLPQTVSIKS